MSNYSQANRLLRIDTTLPTDRLMLATFEGVEAVSGLFRFDLELISEHEDIAPADVLRTPVAVTMTLPDGEPRIIHGIVNRFVQLARREDLVFYRAEMVPWPWFLSLSRDCKIFQDMSVLEIVEEVFQSQGYTDYEIQTTRDYPKRVFCVQYRETHLDFVSRLLEDEGIFYFFRHEEDKHVLVLADSSAPIQPVLGDGVARFALQPAPNEEVVRSVEREVAAHVGKVTLRDYDYLQPSLTLENTLEGDEPEEAYDYPGKYTTLEEGDRYALIRLEAQEALRQVLHGTSSCRELQSGCQFDLEGHFRAEVNGEYILLRVKHRAHGGDYRAWDTAPLDYENEFLAIPCDTPYRPVSTTPRPFIRGLQTALVVGPAGEEVYTDRHGRIKVQFYWDRLGARDENSSCWIRIAMPWAGKGWGSVSIPRIGNEVAVEFLEGDPDRPLITGSVYNGEQTPPFGLPGADIQMGMKSRSSPGGGGFNEFTMTDTKGEEKVNVHAQYDMTTTVLHNDTQTVNNNRTVTVNGTHTETIKKDTSITITNGNLTLTVSDGTADVTVKKAVTETFDATQTTNVKKKIAITSTEADVAITASTEIKLVSGDSSLLLQKDGTIKLIGKSVLIQGENEVNVGGKKIAVSGGDEAKIGVGNQNVTCDKTKVGVSGAAINSSAVGMHEITGGLVKIN